MFVPPTLRKANSDHDLGKDMEALKANNAVATSVMFDFNVDKDTFGEDSFISEPNLVFRKTPREFLLVELSRT
jgi:hypothetical protein